MFSCRKIHIAWGWCVMYYCRMECSRFLVASVVFKCILSPMFSYWFSFWVIYSLLRVDYWSFKQLLNHWQWGSQWQKVLENFVERSRSDHGGTCCMIKVTTLSMSLLLLSICRCLRKNNLLCDPFCGYMHYIYLHIIAMAFELETSLI